MSRRGGIPAVHGRKEVKALSHDHHHHPPTPPPQIVVRRNPRLAGQQGKTVELARQGANHEVYSLDGLMIPIPRHREVGEGLTEAIYRECQDKLGKGWWRR